MFQEKSTSRLYAFALAAALALTPAGCGGGGGTTAAPPDPPAPVDPGPTPEEIEAQAMKQARDAAMAAWMAAMVAVNGAVDPVAMGNAQVYADKAGEASGAAAMAGTSATAGAYRAAAEGHRDSAVEAAGTRGLGLTSLANRITNQNAIDNADLEGRPAVEPVSNAGRVGRELAVTAAATGDSAVVHTGPAGSVSQGGEVSATVEYGASGPAITVTGVGAALLRGEAPVLLTTRGGWMGRELMEDAASDSYAIVYTDIEAPVMRQNYGATADGSGTGPDDAALARGQVITGDVPGDGSTFTGTRNVSPTDNLPPQAGRFHCASGTVGGCAISVDEDGRIVAVQGYGWQPVASGMTPVPDADWLAWGVWLSVPDAAGATDPAAAGAFASGSDVFEVRAELTGTATYHGVATGMYSAGGMVEYFDADVSLTASFGVSAGADSTPETGTAPAVNDGRLLGAVTGSVSRIRAGGMSVAGSLTLGRAPVIAGARDGDSTTGFEGASRGILGGASLKGAWGGQFYGPNDAAADTDAARTEYPTTAAGTFAAAAGSAAGPDPVRILGSFGAWKAE
ncbi:MAG: hypothetical protein F4Y02_00875 [Chloroflexi bacterium]|nr:hypothetical protein [Chloroflexota bacterium]